MTNQIQWETDMARAQARAQAEEKFIHLDFCSPDCISCQEMDAVTYPNVKVVALIEEAFVPLRIEPDVLPVAMEYRVKWTPSLLVLDAEGGEHHRVIGFLPAMELIASLLLGIGKTHLDLNHFDEAGAAFDWVLSEYSYSISAPEAVFFRGMALYKSTHQVHHLKEIHQRLQTKYQYSEWARRASPYGKH
jgi:hypothetical protein